MVVEHPPLQAFLQTSEQSKAHFPVHSLAQPFLQLSVQPEHRPAQVVHSVVVLPLVPVQLPWQVSHASAPPSHMLEHPT